MGVISFLQKGLEWVGRKENSCIYFLFIKYRTIQVKDGLNILPFEEPSKGSE